MQTGLLNARVLSVGQHDSTVACVEYLVYLHNPHPLCTSVWRRHNRRSACQVFRRSGTHQQRSSWCLVLGLDDW